MNQVDLILFTWLAAGHDASLLTPFTTVLATSGSWVSAALLCWIVWRKPEQRSYVFAVLAAAAVAGSLAHSIAAVLAFPRPFAMGLSAPLIEHGARGSLPSAHASVMFTIAFALVVRRGLRTIGMASAAIALAVGLARVHVGVHFPSDIGAGMLLGLAIVGAMLVLGHLWKLLVHVSVTRTRYGRRWSIQRGDTCESDQESLPRRAGRRLAEHRGDDRRGP